MPFEKVTLVEEGPGETVKLLYGGAAAAVIVPDGTVTPRLMAGCDEVLAICVLSISEETPVANKAGVRASETTQAKRTRKVAFLEINIRSPDPSCYKGWRWRQNARLSGDPIFNAMLALCS
jgi:hypothetical protein